MTMALPGWAPPLAHATRRRSAWRFAVLIVMLAAAVPALAQDDDLEKALDPGMPPFDTSWWDWGKPKPFLHAKRLTDPFVSGNNSFLHFLVLMPPMEGHRLLTPKTFSLDIGFEALRCSRPGEGEGNRFDASYAESTYRLGYGLTKFFEVRGGFNVGWFMPDNENAVALTQRGDAVMPPARFDPRPGVGNVEIGLKILAAYEERQHMGMSAILTLKIPVGKTDFLSSGRGDVSLVFVGSWRIDLDEKHHLFAHAQMGICFFDEESVFPEKVYLNPTGVYGLSLVLPLPEAQSPLPVPMALSIWAQGHRNAFRELDVLNQDPVTLHAGVRIMLGGWTLDGSVGVGLTDTSSADVVGNISIGSDF